MLARPAAPTRDLAEWLDELYVAHFPAVFRLCQKLLWNREDAADATHDVFARAARLDRPLGTEAHSRAWLLAVARNRCIDLLRRRARLDDALARSGRAADPFADPERVTVDRGVLQEVLGQLSPRERRLLWLSAVERRSLRDIAAGLRLTQVAAGQALHRARRRAGAIASRVMGVIGLLRVRRPSGLVATVRDALPLALIPVIVISMPSSMAQSPASAHPAALAGAPSTQKPNLGVTRPSIGWPPSPSSNVPSGSAPSSAVIPGADPAVSQVATVLQQAASQSPLQDPRSVAPVRALLARPVPPLTVAIPLGSRIVHLSQ